MNGDANAWAPADIEKLTTMWNDGESADDISAALGRRKSRNAVLGKVHRMKLPDRSIDQRAAAIGAAKRGKRKSPLVVTPPEDRREQNGGGIHKIRAARTGQTRRNIAPPMAGNANAKRLILGQGPAATDAPSVPIREAAFRPLPGTEPVALLDHKDGCRWPVGEDPILFCNSACEERPRTHPKNPVQHYPYCRTHNHMARNNRK